MDEGPWLVKFCIVETPLDKPEGAVFPDAGVPELVALEEELELAEKGALFPDEPEDLPESPVMIPRKASATLSASAFFK